MPWTAGRGGRGELLFHRPDGRVLPAGPVRLPSAGAAGETLQEANRRLGLEISSRTVGSLWDGERMDLHMAVDGLLRCDRDPADEE
jgi:hypothetical protein